jgi:hypothetical protein
MTKRFWRLAIFLAVLCAALPTFVSARTGDGDDATAPAAVVKKTDPAKLGRFDSAPVIDGKLDEAVWNQAVVLKDFLQVQPGDNIEPSQRTEVLLGHDGKTLFIAFRCFDNEPDKIRATIPKRDQIFDDDYVGVYLDTFNDQRRAYIFFFSPLGVQADGIFTESQGEDYSVDVVMDSKGSTSAEGYVVEVAVPFKSLRYEAGEGKQWGAHVFRRIKRGANELNSWMPLKRNSQGTLIQEGKLSGFEDIEAVRTLEIIPSLTISQNGLRLPRPALPGEPFLDTTKFVNRPVGFEPGLTLKYSITPTITLDFAANPDFAQVEADQLVITANQRFPIFFPEKRPFFLEGIDIFQTPLQVVNTRRIVDPDVAVKLSGKQGRTAFGLMLASDAAPGNYSIEERDDPALAPFIEPFLDKNAFIGVLRAKRDIGKESNLGFFATTYNFPQRHNDLAGFDGRFKLDSKTVMTFQAVGTTTRGYFFDPDTTETSYQTGNGFGYLVNYDYTDRNFGYFVQTQGRTEKYRADVGFTRRVGTNKSDLFLRWSTDPKPDGAFTNWRISNFSSASYDWKGRMQQTVDEFQWQFNFKKETFVSVGYFGGHERLFEEEFGPRRSLLHPGAFAGDGERSTNINQIFAYGGSTPNKFISFFQFVGVTRGAFDFDFGNGPKYPRVSPAALANPFAPLDPGRGTELYLETNVTLQPTDALRTSVSYFKSRLHRYDTDRVAYDSNLVSLRATYQFSRFTFVRARFDYDSLGARAFGQYLVGWTPSPGTSFYVGYNDDLNVNGFNPISSRIEDGIRLNGRTFFVKMSYLFRKSL